MHRTIIVLEVLSEELLDADRFGLEEVVHHIREGHWSGAVLDWRSEGVSREAMRGLLLAQGSDPAFLLGEEDHR